MVSWTAPDAIDALVTAFEGDATLSALSPALSVYDYDPSPDEITTDVLVVGYEAQDNQDYAALGAGRVNQDVSVRCLIVVWRPVAAGGTAPKTARDRAEAILERVEALTRGSAAPSVGDQTTRMLVTNRKLGQYASEVGAESVPVRVCSIEFDIAYTSRTS